MPMSDGQYLDCGLLFAIDNREREALQYKFSG
jgi:hypothetical protein